MTVGWIAPLFCPLCCSMKQSGVGTDMPPESLHIVPLFSCITACIYGAVTTARLGSLSKHVLIVRESQVNIRNRKSKPNVTLLDYQTDDTLREHTVSTERHSPGLSFGVNIGPYLRSCINYTWPSFLLSKVKIWCLGFLPHTYLYWEDSHYTKSLIYNGRIDIQYRSHNFSC